MRYAIWYNLRNLKNVKNIYGAVLLLEKLQALACNFTKSNNPPRVFFTFLNCKNGTKMRKAIYFIIITTILIVLTYYFKVNIININTPFLFKSKLVILVIIKVVPWFDGFHFRITPFNPFHSTGLFLYPLEMSGKQRLSDAFKEV